MSRILVTYATMAGSTAEVAQVVGEELTNRGFQVDVLPLREVKDLQPYQAVVVGGPMIMGWHRDAVGFLKRHRQEFKRIPLAVFVLAMSLTRTGEMSLDGVPVLVDEDLPKPPKRSGAPELQGALCPAIPLPGAHRSSDSPGEAGEYRRLWRTPGIRPLEMVGRSVRHGDHPGAGRRAAKLAGDPLLGSGPAGSASTRGEDRRGALGGIRPSRKVAGHNEHGICSARLYGGS